MPNFKLLIASFCMTITLQPCLADNWGGLSGPASPSGTIGPYPQAVIQTSNLLAVCTPANTPPPCTPGQTPGYIGSGAFVNGTTLPQEVGDGSTVGVFFTGIYADPSSPSGLSQVGGDLPLSDFAQSSTVNGLTTQVGGLSSTVGSLTASFNALSATVGSLSTEMQLFSSRLDQLQQELSAQDRSLRQGVAMSLAMDGVGDLGPDEKVAISMNFGTFGGQSGIAAGVAFRVADHVTFNGGFGTGVRGGLSGGRVGVRFAW